MVTRLIWSLHQNLVQNLSVMAQKRGQLELPAGLWLVWDNDVSCENEVSYFYQIARLERERWSCVSSNSCLLYFEGWCPIARAGRK